MPTRTVYACALLGVAIAAAAGCFLDAGGTADGAAAGGPGGAGGAPPGTCDDGVKNGAEGDVDCGGACPPCAHGRTCSVDEDCAGLCREGVCVPAGFGVWTADEATGPPARLQFAMAWHGGAAGHAVMFGGLTTIALDDTWTWDGAAWMERTGGDKPPARYGAAMASDEARDRVVLFGGVGAGPPPEDTWLWDGGAWTAVTPASSPPARYYAAMAYDRARSNVVLFGGIDGTGQEQNDTWLWNGTTWSEVTSGSAPPPRYLPAMAWDDARQHIVMFGGKRLSDMVKLGDTWTWDGATWTEQTASGAPSPRYGHTMAYEAALERVVLLGGTDDVGVFDDTWEHDGERWTQSTTAAALMSNYGGMVHDPGRHRVTLLLGSAVFNVPSQTWHYHALAVPCGAHADCGSNHCVDSLCCETGCAACEACNTLEQPGTCAPVRNAQDPDSCSGPNTCDANGVCQPQ